MTMVAAFFKLLTKTHSSAANRHRDAGRACTLNHFPAFSPREKRWQTVRHNLSLACRVIDGDATLHPQISTHVVIPAARQKINKWLKEGRMEQLTMFQTLFRSCTFQKCSNHWTKTVFSFLWACVYVKHRSFPSRFYLHLCCAMQHSFYVAAHSGQLMSY